jgi:hypothetical protein
MFSSKFAHALSKALAARSSAEMTAAGAAATIAVVAGASTVMAADRDEDVEQNQKMTKKQQPMALPNPLYLLNSMNQTQCDTGGLLKNPRPFRSRLARRRTIEKMQDTSTKATLSSKYTVEKKPLGEGAFGAVYLGRHKLTQEKVAIKKIPKKLTSDENFQREMEALMHIRSAGGHPNICGLRENFDEGQYYFLVLDLVSGGEMFDHLCDQGPYSEADAARLVREVAQALAFCHGIGLVHGDLVS